MPRRDGCRRHARGSCSALCCPNGEDYKVTGYLALLRRNRNFRLLYIGQTISHLGDWFNAVAVYALLLDLTGSATAVARMMIVQFLPVAIAGPTAGVLFRPFDRCRPLTGTYVLRGALI